MNIQNKRHTIGMNTSKGIGAPALIAILAVIASVGGLVYYNAMYPVADKMMEQGDAMMTEGEEMMEEGETMMKEGDAMMKEGESMMEQEDGAMMEDGGVMSGRQGAFGPVDYYGEVLAGSHDDALLLDFNKQDYENAVINEKLVVLYFYANWCPVCKAEFPLMQSAFNELNKQVVGFRVNFNDNETDAYEKGLASQFGVAYQHTKVFIQDGKRVLKSPEGWDKARYISEITDSLN